jgi:RTX calcium-binding nonapeptide repeat (4 copies)
MIKGGRSRAPLPGPRWRREAGLLSGRTGPKVKRSGPLVLAAWGEDTVVETRLVVRGFRRGSGRAVIVVAVTFVASLLVAPAYAHTVAGTGPNEPPLAECWASGFPGFFEAQPSVVIHPQFDKVTSFGGSQRLAWLPVFFNIDRGTYLNTDARIVSWQISDWLPPGADYLPGKVGPLLLPPADYHVGVWYAWNLGTGWRYHFHWVVDQYSDGDQGTYWQFDSGAFSGFTTKCRLKPDTTVLPGYSFGSTAVVSGRLEQLTRLAVVSRKPTATGASPTRTLDSESMRCFGRKATLVGTTSGDVLVGTRYPDVIVGLESDDIILGGGGADFICGGEGGDGVAGEEGADHLQGESGNDAFLGGNGPDLLEGGTGFDIIDPGAGTDRASGGRNLLDILDYEFTPAAVTVDFATGIANGYGRDSFEGFNTVVGSNADDVLQGTSGQQLFVPLAGDDQVTGGGDSDLVLYLFSSVPVDVDLSIGHAVGEGDDTLSELEIIIGTQHDDTILGDEDYNAVFGLEGDDTLDGIAGEDTIDAGVGEDTCVNGLIYVECENQGANIVLPTPPTVEVPDA